MASIWVSERATKKGKRFDVRFEGPPQRRVDGTTRSRIHCGTFATRREADTRARWARNEWAAGRVPDPDRIVLEQLRASRRSMRSVGDAWLASRGDLASLTIANYRHRVDTIVGEFPGDPAALTVADVREWFTRLAAAYAPGTVGQVRAVLVQLLDFAEVDPNPARHRSIRLRNSVARIRVPSRSTVAAIRGAIHQERYRLLLDFLEDTGCRVSEAVALRWDDVEEARVHVPGAKGRGGAVKWRWIDEDLHPIRLLHGVRGSGLVFGATDAGFRNQLEAACVRAGVGRHSPHDFRHLHASRLMASNSPRVAEIAARLGHANASMLIEVYTHVTEPP